MEPSKEVEEWVRAATGKLDYFYAGIVGCHVDLRIPHRHHKKGAAYQIRIDLTVPHGHIVVKREPSLGPRYRQLRFAQLRKHAEVNSEHKIFVARLTTLSRLLLAAYKSMLDAK